MSEPEEDLQKAYDDLERDWIALMAVKGSVFRYCYDSLPGPEGPASIEAKGHMDACLDVLDILEPQWRDKPWEGEVMSEFHHLVIDEHGQELRRFKTPGPHLHLHLHVWPKLRPFDPTIDPQTPIMIRSVPLIEVAAPFDGWWDAQRRAWRIWICPEGFEESVL